MYLVYTLIGFVMLLQECWSFVKYTHCVRQCPFSLVIQPKPFLKRFNSYMHWCVSLDKFEKLMKCVCSNNRWWFHWQTSTDIGHAFIKDVCMSCSWYIFSIYKAHVKVNWWANNDWHNWTFCKWLCQGYL